MEQEGSKAIKAGIGYTVGNYMLKGLSFLTVPIFSHILSPADFGIFNKYLAYQCMVFLLVGLSFHTSVKNAKYRYGEKFSEYNSCCILLAIWSLLIWLVVCNGTYFLYGEWLGFSRTVVNVLLLDSFGTAMIQFFNAYVGLYYRYDSFLKIAAFNALANLGLSVLLILTVYDGDRATGRIMGNAIPVMILAVVIIWYFWRQQKPAFSHEYASFALRYSVPLIPHGISQLVVSQFDRLMIEKMIGAWESGLYSFAYIIFSIINVTSTSLESVWGPWFYEQMKQEDHERIRKYSSKYAFGMLLLSSLVMLAAEELVIILGDREYWTAKYMVVPLVIGGYYMFLCTIPISVEYYYEKTKFVAVGTVSTAAINVVLNLFCITRFGYMAAAYTTLVTYLIYFTFHYFIAWRVAGKSMFQTGRLVLYMFAAALAGAVSLVFIEQRLIRLPLFLAVGVLAVVWEEREVGILAKIRGRLGK